jgi:hypothetical protein
METLRLVGTSHNVSAYAYRLIKHLSDNGVNAPLNIEITLGDHQDIVYKSVISDVRRLEKVLDKSLDITISKRRF